MTFWKGYLLGVCVLAVGLCFTRTLFERSFRPWPSWLCMVERVAFGAWVFGLVLDCTLDLE